MPTRRATSDDLPVLLPLIGEFYLVDGHEFDERRIVAALSPLLADDALGQVWVLDDGDDVSGYVMVTWSWSLESGGRDCILDELYVRDQGQGRGSELIERAILEAEQSGALAIFLETEEHNARARGFYARHGLQVENSVWMSMPLPRSG
jgi:GNAT superfamily N-acetyltransferase